MMNKLIIGHIEHIEFPRLGFSCYAKTDTGACTSALHADNIHIVEEDGQQWAQFEVHFKSEHQKITAHCRERLIGQRDIKSSNGHISQRYVITTIALISELELSIELTLSHRGSMTFPMLLGRKAIAGNFLVDVDQSAISSGL